MNTESISTAQIEQIVIKIMKNRLQEAMEEYVEKNELRAKELALMERVVRVEEELRSLREMSEAKFEASEKRFESLQREMNARFEAMDKRFESLQREMNARFEAVDNRFVSMDKRFESLQREMSARFEAVDNRFVSMDKRFEAMDKRFSMVQWMIGILVGIPALTFTIIQLVKVL